MNTEIRSFQKNQISNQFGAEGIHLGHFHLIFLWFVLGLKESENPQIGHRFLKGLTHKKWQGTPKKSSNMVINRYIIYIYTSKTVTHNHFGKVVLQKSFWGRWKLLNILRNKMKKHMFLNTFSCSSTMTSLDLFSFLLLLLSVACWIKSEFNSWDGQRMPKDFNISMPGRFIHKTSTCLVGLSESDVITMIVLSGTTKRNLHISQSCGFHISHIFNISKPQRCRQSRQ